MKPKLSGYYCMSCHHIDFHTPDFETWLKAMPRWIVRSKGDKWRDAAEQSVEPTCPTCGKNLNTEYHSPDCTYYKSEAAHASRWQAPCGQRSIMFDILRGFFGKTPVAGEVYEFYKNSDNPFDNDRPHKVEVIAVKNGWVNYRFLNSQMWQNESMKIGSFRFCYRLANIACSGQEPAGVPESKNS